MIANTLLLIGVISVLLLGWQGYHRFQTQAFCVDVNALLSVDVQASDLQTINTHAHLPGSFDKALSDFAKRYSLKPLSDTYDGLSSGAEQRAFGKSSILSQWVSIGHCVIDLKGMTTRYSKQDPR